MNPELTEKLMRGKPMLQTKRNRGTPVNYCKKITLRSTLREHHPWHLVRANFSLVSVPGVFTPFTTLGFNAFPSSSSSSTDSPNPLLGRRTIPANTPIATDALPAPRGECHRIHALAFSPKLLSKCARRFPSVVFLRPAFVSSPCFRSCFLLSPNSSWELPSPSRLLLTVFFHRCLRTDVQFSSTSASSWFSLTCLLPVDVRIE